jgi:hypothetical protein
MLLLSESRKAYAEDVVLLYRIFGPWCESGLHILPSDILFYRQIEV